MQLINLVLQIYTCPICLLCFTLYLTIKAPYSNSYYPTKQN